MRKSKRTNSRHNRISEATNWKIGTKRKTSRSNSDRSSHCSIEEFRRNGLSRKRHLSRDSIPRHNKKRKIEKIDESFWKTKKKLEEQIERKCSITNSREIKNKKSITNVKDVEEQSENRDKNDEVYQAEYDKRMKYLSKYGKNFYCPFLKERTGLRPIYIDGSNVAYSHGQHEKFSVIGLKICIDFFRKRGHDVKAFFPNFRLKKGQSTDHGLLHKLVAQKVIVTTPTLYIDNQRRSPYDDWYIVQSAAVNGGIIVSADNFQDIIKWNPNMRSVVEQQRLVHTFVDDMIIFPVDPHGNRQNNLEEFLKF